jgi:hypothetical protein
MKKKLKLVGIIALVALIMFPFVSYGQSSSSQVLTLTSIDDLDKWLDSQPFNTPQTSYSINLNVRDLTGINFVLKAYPKKYIFLDLSGSSITEIPNGSFKYDNFTNRYESCAMLTGITLPNSIIRIRSESFYGQTSLTSVIIPNGVTSIGNSAFYCCSSLTNVTIPNSVTSIGGSVFNGCSSLTNVIIPNGVTNIEYSTFNGCSSLTNVIIPNTVTRIGNYAFEGCSSLTSIIIPDSVTIIGDRAFKGCKNLASVTIGRGVTSIYEEAFVQREFETSLNRVEFKGTIPMENFHVRAFGISDYYHIDRIRGNLREKFYETNSRSGGNPGIYTSVFLMSGEWTKQ